MTNLGEKLTDEEVDGPDDAATEPMCSADGWAQSPLIGGFADNIVSKVTENGTQNEEKDFPNMPIGSGDTDWPQQNTNTPNIRVEMACTSSRTHRCEAVTLTGISQ